MFFDKLSIISEKKTIIVYLNPLPINVCLVKPDSYTNSFRSDGAKSYSIVLKFSELLWLDKSSITHN